MSATYARQLQWLLWISAIAIGSVVALVFFRASLSNWLAFCLLLVSIVFGVAAIIGIGYQIGLRGAWGRAYGFLRTLLRF